MLPALKMTRSICLAGSVDDYITNPRERWEMFRELISV